MSPCRSDRERTDLGTHGPARSGWARMDMRTKKSSSGQALACVDLRTTESGSPSEEMAANTPDRMPEDMPDRTPERMPQERLSEDVPLRMSEDMPVKTSEDMPERMSDNKPDRMPEHMPH